MCMYALKDNKDSSCLNDVFIQSLDWNRSKQYTGCLTDPSLASLNHFVLIMNYPTKERHQDHVKQASRFDKRIWNTSNDKITSLRNSSAKIYFLLLLLHKIICADADETCSQASTPSFSINIFRVRATGRHYRQMRRKNIFGTKKPPFFLAKTSGEKKIIL